MSSVSSGSTWYSTLIRSNPLFGPAFPGISHDKILQAWHSQVHGFTFPMETWPFYGFERGCETWQTNSRKAHFSHDFPALGDPQNSSKLAPGRPAPSKVWRIARATLGSLSISACFSCRGEADDFLRHSWSVGANIGIERGLYVYIWVCRYRGG